MADEKTDESAGARLVIHFNVKERVEITELARSFEAVADLYREFLLEQEEGQDKESDANLYITTINNNCIYVELAYYLKDALEPAISIMGQFNIFIDFIDNIELLIAYFMGASRDSSFKPKNPKSKATSILNLLKCIKYNTDDELDDKFIIRATKNGKKGSKPRSVNLSGKDIPEIIKGAKRVINPQKKQVTIIQIQEIYPTAIDVYNGGKTLKDGMEHLVKEVGMNAGTAGVYIKFFVQLKKGELHQDKMAANILATNYFFEKAHADSDKDGLESALKSLWKYIEYYENLDGGHRLPGFRRIHAKFSAKLKSLTTNN